MGEQDDAEALRDRCGVPAFLPVMSPGDDGREGSKLGGTPWLEDAWPSCGGCTQPLRFLLQLRRDEVPPSCRWAFRTDLLQLFLCDAQGKPDEPGWLCQAQGSGWEPFAASTLVRHVACVGQPLDLSTALLEAARLSVAYFEHVAMNAYLEQCGDAPLPEPTPMRLAARAAQLLEVPQTLDAFLTRRAWLYPPQRIASWTEFLDVPAYGDLSLDEVELLEQALDLRCSPADKLAGVPAWIQDPAVPSCGTCRAPMRVLSQLRTQGPIHIGGDGTGWLFVCPTCQGGTFSWQR
jgi:hypothetical protein